MNLCGAWAQAVKNVQPIPSCTGSAWMICNVLMQWHKYIVMVFTLKPASERRAASRWWFGHHKMVLCWLTRLLLAVRLLAWKLPQGRPKYGLLF